MENGIPTPRDLEQSVSLSVTSTNEAQGLNQSTKSIDIQNLANITLVDGTLRAELRKYITAPYDVKTPKEKVKKRPDGFDYVESSFMDHETKKFMPLYEFQLLHTSVEFGWINIIVSLKDRITGNTELGAGSARIQVSRGVETPGFRDVIDMGNNIKAALTNAIKNAQSRFGIAADVYQRRESVPTDAERERFENLKNQIYTLNPTRAKQFAEQWSNLGTDWTEFMDKWQVYVDRQSNNNQKEK